MSFWPKWICDDQKNLRSHCDRKPKQCTLKLPVFELPSHNQKDSGHLYHHIAKITNQFSHQ